VALLSFFVKQKLTTTGEYCGIAAGGPAWQRSPLDLVGADNGLAAESPAGPTRHRIEYRLSES
jgi:hypothetical protein